MALIRRQLTKLFRAGDTGRVINGYLRPLYLQEERGVMHSDVVKKLEVEPDERLWMARAFWFFDKHRLKDFRETWVERPRSLKGKLYMAMAASASPGSFEREIDAIREAFPAEVELLTGLRRFYQGRPEEGMAGLRRGLEMQRQLGWADPTVMSYLMQRLLGLVLVMNREEMRDLFAVMEEPFQSGLEQRLRLKLQFDLSCYLGDDYKRRVLTMYGGKVPPTGSAMAIAADLPERKDAQQAYERFLRRGGKLPAGFATRREPGPGLQTSPGPSPSGGSGGS